MTEREKMLAGQLYRASDPELSAMARRARDLVFRYNHLPPAQEDTARALLDELFGSLGAGGVLVPPFHCDYGTHIHAGDNFYMNSGGVILDVCEVRIGHGVMCGPGVHLYTATHPLDPAVRASGLENGAPIAIGDNVWLGGGVIVCPGVTIGRDTVVGAGAIVTRDLPAGVLAAGNPARVLRPIASSGPS
ncbi:MAG: sugar O-acetyltransferase [Sumerlaeia bacterium]